MVCEDLTVYRPLQGGYIPIGGGGLYEGGVGRTQRTYRHTCEGLKDVG
ncbi:MAG: hypothetical protein GF368_01720 [Candidatus Aenigmarchaeota archaeon]|nr:hypothetical protein [Candidatus Aenigmarchaeota archaeon]